MADPSQFGSQEIASMKVLIATDGSHNAYEAARMFATLPHSGPLDVHILTVIYMPPDDSGGMAYAWLPEFIQTEESRAKEGFEKVAALFVGDDIVTNHLICHGHVGHTITEEAKRAKAELIVIGAQGHSAIARVLLGSTSDFVATQACCSVLAVRSDKVPDTSTPMRVVIAYDGSEPARLAVDEFVKSSWGPKCDVHLVHVLPHGSMFTRATAQDIDAARKEGQAIIEEVAQRLSPAVSNVATHILEGDSIGQVITEFAEQNGVDLVMLGDTGRSAISQLFLGSVTRYVLRHAQCSVWIARKTR
jgi:nucleotide-binding universal stress UspA family protein